MQNFQITDTNSFFFQHQLLLPGLDTKGVLPVVASLGSRGASLSVTVCMLAHVCVHTRAHVYTDLPLYLTNFSTI